MSPRWDQGVAAAHAEQRTRDTSHRAQIYLAPHIRPAATLHHREHFPVLVDLGEAWEPDHVVIGMSWAQVGDLYSQLGMVIQAHALGGAA